MDQVSIIQPVFEDESLVVFDKPQGLAASKGKTSSLCDLVFECYPGLADVHGYNTNEGGMLNRLDNDTGGLVMFAKSDKAFEYYLGLMQDEKIRKTYNAITDGKLKSDKGVVDTPIAHHPKNKKKMMVIDTMSGSFRGKPRISWTNWDFIGKIGSYNLLEVTIVKGLRHQIRVHLASVGQPIVGDKLYNRRVYPVKYHQLYACGLEFTDMFGKQRSITVSDKLELHCL